MAKEFYLNEAGLQENMSSMRTGEDVVMEGIEKIKAGINDMPANFKGETADRFVQVCNEMQDELKKNVEESMNGLLDFVKNFTERIFEGDMEGANSLLGR